MTEPASPRRMGLRARSALSFGIGALLVASFMAALTFTLARSYLLGQREDGALRQSYFNARLVRSTLRDPDADVAAVLNSLRPDGGSDAAVRVGDKWYSTSVGLSVETLPPSVVAAVQAGGAAHQVVDTPTGTVFVSGIALPAVGAEYYELFPLTELDSTLRTIAAVSAVSAGVAALAGSVVGFYASRRVLRPLRDVATTATEISSGALDRRLSIRSDPDLSPLTDAFNRMVDALGERIDREARFSSDVSHEMRTPLAAMGAAMAVAERRSEGLPDDIRDVLQVIGEQVESFQALTLDLLEIARLDAGTEALVLDPVDPMEFARQVVGSLGASSRIEVVADESLGDGPHLVLGDKRRLRQVFTNLITNADRYGGGADRMSVCRRSEPTGDVVRLTVEDRGPGVAGDEREAVFGRFARGTVALSVPAVRGSGLGLSLARQHVTMHGGRIWVDDRPGGGARFIVELPVAAEEPD